MQLLVTETRYQGQFFDRLFKVDRDHITSIERLFDEHEICQPKQDLLPVQLPRELVHKIVFQTILQLLRYKNFDLATQLIAFDVATIHRFYHGLFCGADLPWREKYRRISRVIHIVSNIYEEYFLTEAHVNTPAIILDHEKRFQVSSTQWFFPWQLDPTVSIAEIDQLELLRTRKLVLGPLFGDCALLVSPRERRGVLYGEQFVFPYIHFIFMDVFAVLNVFKHPETRYYFTRFAMFIKAVFGGYTQVYFYKQKVENEEDDGFLTKYIFEELPNCMRK